MDVSNLAGRVASSVDPDQTPWSVTFDLDLGVNYLLCLSMKILRVNTDPQKFWTRLNILGSASDPDPLHQRKNDSEKGALTYERITEKTQIV